MITGVRLSELAIGSPILSASWEYKELTGKEAVIKRLEDQFYHASYLGFTYVIDTIRPNITSNGRLTLENNGINGDIWTFDERMAKYHEFASANHMTVMLEVEFTVQVTENNVDEYVRFILSSLVARYQWVKRWIIGVNPDKTYADGTYNCSPELYVYMMNELYKQIKLFDHTIQVGGPNIYESITPFLHGRTGWLAEASGEFYTTSSDYLDIGPHGFLTDIDFFTFQGKQDSAHYNYNDYGSIVSNIRTLIHDHLGDNALTLFSTTQGHAANFSNNTALMTQPYYDLREILKATKNGVVAFKNELIDAYPDSQAWQGHFDSSRLDYGIMRWSMHSKVAYSSYQFIFNALDGYITLKNVTDIYEEDDNLESITFQKVIEGTVYNTTIIWCKNYNTATVSLLQASFNRSYQLLNGTKTSISDNVDINLLAGHFLVVYDEVEELELDKEDIRLNIERRLRYQREINDQMLAELPSSFNKEVTDTNVYKLLRAVSAELADTSMILTMIKEDLYLDTARENSLYENFGTLVKLQKRNDWTYEKYRRLVRGVMASLLKGPTYQSVIDALSLFTNFKVSIAECYKDVTKVKYADVIGEINPLFSFIIELEKPLEDNSIGQDELMEDTAYVLQLVKPAHTIGILVIILTGSERWDTYYAQKYGIDWHEADEDGLSASFGQSLNEGTFGWRHFNYPGNFTLSNGVISNSSLTNNGALIGPRYVLADRSLIEGDVKNNELFDMSHELQEYIYTFLHSNEKDTYETPEEKHEESISNVETRFGFAYNKYLRLTGSKGRTTLNNYLLSAKSSLKDEHLFTYNSFNEDRFMFSNLLKVIRFSNNYGISSRFANNIDVLTHWTEFLKEQSFRKIISLENDQVIEVERITEDVPTIGLEGQTLQEFLELDQIKDLYINEVTLTEDAHIPDDPLGSFRTNYPYPSNHGFNNHKLGPNRREKYNLATFFSELYDKSTDYLSIAFGFELVEKYAREINDSRIEFSYDHSLTDRYEIYHKPIQFNILKNLQYIPGQLKYSGDVVNGNEFADDFEEYLGDPQLSDILKQIYENDTVNYVENDPYEIQNLLVKLNLIRDNPLLADKTDKLDKWIQSIHGSLRTPVGLQLRRTFIRKSVEKYTIGFGLKEEYLTGYDSYKSAYTDFSYDTYQFDISEEENHKDVYLYENASILDYPNSGFNDRQFNQGRFSISKTVLTELQVDTFFEEYDFNQLTDFNRNDILLLPKDDYDFDISEYEEHNDIFVWEEIDDPYAKLTEWHPSFELTYQVQNEQSLLHLYKKENDKYNFDIYEYETHNDVYFSENASVLDYTGNVPIEFNTTKFNKFRFSNNKAILYERKYEYVEDNFNLPTDILYSYIINDDYFNELDESVEFTDNIFSEYYDFYDEDYDFIRLNRHVGRFIGYQSNLIIPITDWQDNYDRLTTDSLIFSNNHSEIFNTPDDLYIANYDSSDQYTLYDDENESLRLNHYKGKFVKYKTAIYSFNPIEYDVYKLPIYESTNFITDSLDSETFNTPVDVDESVHNLLDQFTLYDNENEALRLNHYKGKFIKYRTAVYSLNSIEYDVYKLPIYESTNFITDSSDVEIFNKPIDIDESIHNLLDQFTLYDDENESLRLNHYKGKFVKYRTAVYSLNPIEYDIYKLPIYESTNFITDSLDSEVFNKPIDIDESIHNFLDKFTLYDDENESLKLNHPKGKFVKYRAAIYSLNSTELDIYKLPIYDNLQIEVSQPHEDIFNKPDDVLIPDNIWVDKFTLYDSENDILRLNHPKGKFIKYNTTKVDWSNIYFDKYTNPIFESTHFTTVNINNDLYSIKNDVPNFENDLEEQFLIYDEETEILRLNHLKDGNSEVHSLSILKHMPSFGRFIGKRANIYSSNLDYNDLYKLPIYESTNFITDSIYNEVFNTPDSEFIIDNDLYEKFSLYDEDNKLRLNKYQLNQVTLISHLGSKISYYTDYNDIYKLPIYESTNFITESIYDEYFNKPNSEFIIDNDFTEKFSLYDEDNKLRFNKHQLNRTTLISRLGSIISYYTDYDELYKTPSERSLLILDKNFSDNYLFDINESDNFDNEFNEQYVPYDEDKALILNKRLLNKSPLLSHIGSVIKFYTSYSETYNDVFERSSFIVEDPFQDDYSLNIEDVYEDPYIDLSEYVCVQHTNLILNRRTLNQSILSGTDWDKYHPYIFYNDIYSNVITDRLLNDISLKYKEQYLPKNDDYHLTYDDYSKEVFDVVYNQSFIRDLSLLEYNQCFDDLYHQMIFDHLLVQINWYKEEIVNLVHRIQEEKHLEYESFESENADFKYHKKFIFSSGKFNEPIGVDTEKVNINVYQVGNDKFVPKEDTNHQDIYKFNQDIIDELAEAKFNPELENQDKYHNMNSLDDTDDKFKFNQTLVNHGTLITNSEIVEPEVINKDKYHPTVTELEYQRVITLTEKVKKPTSVIVIEKNINEEAYIMQPNIPIQFTTPTFNQKRFYRKNVIDTSSLKESHNDKFKKVRETQISVSTSAFREKKTVYKDDVSINNTYFNNDKYIFKMKESNHLDTNVNKTDNYQIKAAVAYMKLEKVLRGQLLTIRRGTYV